MAIPDLDNPAAGPDKSGEPDELNEHWEEPGDPDGVVAADKRRRQEQGHPAPPHSGQVRYDTERHWPKPPRPHVHVPWRRLLGAVLIIAVACGAYWLGTRQAAPATPKSAAAGTTPQLQVQADALTAPLKPYTSPNFNLGMSYPGSWTVSDTAAKLTVTSPALAMTGLTGSVAGHIVLTVQNQTSTIPGYPDTDAMANLPSAQLTYAHPSSVQRTQTYLTFVAYHNPNGIDGLYLTGSTAYKTGAHVPMNAVTQGNPLVSVTFQTCSNAACHGGTVKPLTLLAKGWDRSVYKPVIINLLQSLTFN